VGGGGGGGGGVFNVNCLHLLEHFVKSEKKKKENLMMSSGLCRGI